MQVAIELALEDAGVRPEAIGYINAHGTATAHGDIEESMAVLTRFGRHTPISSLKSYMGHTLGACGALEAWMTIGMMNADCFYPTINLETIDPACADVDYIHGEARSIQCEYVMSNNFAFGGVNTSLIFRRWR
jgi:3-oxoacyl-[acyl-carrier-protein] synthase II